MVALSSTTEFKHSNYMNNIYPNADAAIANVHDGATIMVGRFGLCKTRLSQIKIPAEGTPWRLIPS
jgi:hypothetical protein